MNDCCNTEDKQATTPRKFICPENNTEYAEVTLKTLLHHIKFPWLRNMKNQPYYFCHDPECDVVYFGLDGTTISTAEVRTRIGIKDKNPQSFICYCFGVTKNDALRYPEIKTFVTQQTQNKMCACETRNPSGHCCLKDFPISNSQAPAQK